MEQDSETILQPESEEITRHKFSAKKIWQKVAPNLVNLVNLTAMLTIAGFFVIQSYLASFSRLFTFNISVAQYLAAGINLILGILWILVIPPLGYGLVLALVLIGLSLLGRLFISRSKRIHTFWTNILRHLYPLYQFLKPYLLTLWSIYQVTAGILFVLLVVGLGLVYGTFYYANSPRMFGGGMPADIILIFREDQPTQNSIWSFPINATNPRQSERVELLIELTDGMIVRDPTTGITVMIKNDVVQGIIDVSVSTSNTLNLTATPVQLPPTQIP